MSKRLVALSTVAILIAAASGGARAQSFYERKTLRLIVGFAPGGGFDTYARVLSRHMGRHIPGNPTIVVENMTGAGSLISANHLYRVAKPDGLTIGHFNGALFARPLALPPGMSKERADLAASFPGKTLHDTAFLAEVEKVKLTLDPVTAEDLERMVAEAFALDPALLAKLKDILYK